MKEMQRQEFLPRYIYEMIVNQISMAKTFVLRKKWKNQVNSS